MSDVDVTEAELAVLERLWEMPKATIRELTGQLYPHGGTAHYATVQKLLERLEGKGCVKRFATGTPHLFQATVCRDELLGSRLKAVADRLCEGSLTPLLTHLVQSKELSQRDIEELRALIDQRDKGSARKNKQ